MQCCLGVGGRNKKEGEKRGRQGAKLGRRINLRIEHHTDKSVIYDCDESVHQVMWQLTWSKELNKGRLVSIHKLNEDKQQLMQRDHSDSVIMPRTVLDRETDA